MAVEGYGLRRAAERVLADAAVKLYKPLELSIRIIYSNARNMLALGECACTDFGYAFGNYNR